MTLMEQQLAACILGEHYPKPIVDLEKTRKHASEIVWGLRVAKSVKEA